jgi:hypothetical protein
MNRNKKSLVRMKFSKLDKNKIKINYDVIIRQLRKDKVRMRVYV